MLAIDDDEAILELMHDILSEECEVSLARSGFEALKQLGEQRFDVIVSDMRMPGLSGRDVHVWLAQHYAGEERRIIFTTGDTFEAATRAFLEQSGNRCLAKPFTVQSLREAVREVASAGAAAAGA